MRHQKAGKRLNRSGSHRNAMFRNMVTSLFKHGQIRTTDAKAKELRRWADRMITLAKRGDLHARRQALAVMRDKDEVHKLFEEAAKRFGDRAGGYTNVIRIGRRRGDAAPMSLVELVTPQEKKEKKKKKPKAAKKKVQRAEKPIPEKVQAEEPNETKTEDKGAVKEITDQEKEETSAPESEAQAEEEAKEADVEEPEADQEATEQEEAAAPESVEEAQEVEADSEDKEDSESEEDQEKT